ncbi:hypothetical protein BDQ12DRAFT_720699 [Crucibulum laeve]|uniref:Uncharacterized protein n=1 Tax=Crucibulum laeve TaxID=68775 RepID=A0A5C3MIG2_9AGAR|nr:hypothetical protein BDQ12DRAFT_720699 [Crucibulum laeve]
MHCFAPSPIPHISISPAPPQESPAEPYSPFSRAAFPVHDADSFRPQHLTPPPTHTKFNRQLSPLRPSEVAVSGKGLGRDRFEALLKASKERNYAAGTGKKVVDLRKEIALKAHKNKQVERRALFLSKICAPPSPTATSTPKTPPESPAIFHYRLPSPGLVSPLALFDSLNENIYDPTSEAYACQPWVEQVDFRLPDEPIKPKVPALHLMPSIRSGQSMPSLDQITARLNSQGHALIGRPAISVSINPPCLPSTRPRLSVGVGRLQIPLRVSKAIDARPSPPKSPMSLLPALQVTTTVVPRTATTSPTELSESNLLALDSRERKAHNMLSTLRRRTVFSEYGSTGHNIEEADGRRVRWKRHSAPADLMPRERIGLEHPVLLLPGGF